MISQFTLFDMKPAVNQRNPFRIVGHFHAQLMLYSWFIAAFGFSLCLVLQALMSILSPAAKLGLLIVGAMSFFMSQKFAGPLYRLKKHLDDSVANRKQSHVKLRDGDYFMELAESMNRYTDTFKK